MLAFQYFRLTFRLLPVGLLLLLAGCATSRPGNTDTPARRFDFQNDTFAFRNDLVWEYSFDANGKWTSRPRQPEPDYHHHCFVLARSARQFFLNAKFDPSLPVADEQTYRHLIHQVVSSNPRKARPVGKKIIIPGYADLHSFSAAQERLLKAECGGAWQSYFQRGHWRVVFPFSRSGQDKMAQQLLEELRLDPPVVVHVIRFPVILINHALVLFDVKENEAAIQFMVYDPNDPTEPKVLTFERQKRTFFFPTNDYFPGGRVDVYEVYHAWDY